MKEFTISQNDAGQRLDRFLAKAVPLLPASLAQKYIRLKRIKCNGKRIDRDTRLNAGDVLQLYINDEFFDKPREDNAYLTVATPKLNIVYEDEHILLVDKILYYYYLYKFQYEEWLLVCILDVVLVLMYHLFGHNSFGI